MSMDFNGRESEKPITDQEGVMFAAQPVWERSRKRKGFGARRAATPVAQEPRSFAAERDEEPMALDTPVDRAYGRSEYVTTHSTLAAEPEVEGDGGLVAPIGIGRGASRSTRAKASGGVAPAAIAAGVLALGALGATGWYMSRADTSGVPELTPGSTTSQVAVAPLTPTAPPAQVAVNDTPPPPAPAPRAAEPARTSTPARSTARARPAQASSAATAGVNASATTALPDGPQPYSSASPSQAPAPVNPPVVALPPASEAPAAVPSTPPTATPEPAPTTEAPTPQTAAPPQ